MNDIALESVEYRRDIGEYVSALRRRRNPMLMTFAAVLGISVLVAVLLPPVFRSTATILIEEQEIPQDLVRTTITSFADQRIQVISQQVMTRANLMQIIEKYDLYARQRRMETTEEVIDTMRKDIKLDLVTTDIADRRTGGKTTATIAFTLGYDSVSPEKAQKVANELTSLYLNENLQIRKQKADETSIFLAEEAERLRTHIGEIEENLATFKTKNQGRLPELTQINMQMRDRAESELSEVDRKVASVEERRFYLQAQLAQIKPNTPILSSTGEHISDPEDRLKALRAQYAGMEGLYSRDHPDMVRARRQMDSLEKETGLASDGGEESKQLVKLKGDLASISERYSEDHPDVVKLKNTIAALEDTIAKTPTRAASSTRKAENPAYLALDAQLAGLDTESRELAKQRQYLQGRVAMLESRLERTPAVEREYLDLARDRENSVLRYREIKAKLMEAEVAQELEKDRKSERFSMIDPPQFPEKPRSPNRPAILIIGILLSLASGVGSVAVLEAMDGSVRNSKDLLNTLPIPLLSMIPYIRNDADRQKKEAAWKWIVPTGVGVLAVSLLAIHLLWMPLEVLWFAVMRRILSF